jgi:S-adenosylmethionine decarboxylase
MNKLLFLLLLPILIYSDEYEFRGRHFLASYVDCDNDAISDPEMVRYIMDKAVSSSGATILDSRYCQFGELGGVTIVYLLAESHASIHTYPEHNSVFVDIFTCGDSCTVSDFDAILQWYFKPKVTHALLLSRSKDIEELVLDCDLD